MLLVPNVVFTRYVAHLNTRGIAADRHGDYKKWLRYYLDFCDKYPVPESKPERVRQFCEKMHEKKQSEKQWQQAAHAVSLYFEMVRQQLAAQTQDNLSCTEEKPEKVAKSILIESSFQYASSDFPEEILPDQVRRSPSQYTEAGYHSTNYWMKYPAMPIVPAPSSVSGASSAQCH